MAEAPKASKLKKILVVAGVVIVLAAVAGVGVFLIKDQLGSKNGAAQDSNLRGENRAADEDAAAPVPAVGGAPPELPTFTPRPRVEDDDDDDYMPEGDEAEEEAYEEEEEGEDFGLIWADEFDDIDASGEMWMAAEGDGCHEGMCGFGNHEAQYYTPKRCEIVDGIMIMSAGLSTKHRMASGALYSSCKLTVQPDYALQTGRIEIRAKVPRAQGAQTSFHLVPVQRSDQDWPNGGYGQGIEIMEVLNAEEPLSSAVYYGTDAGMQPYHRRKAGCRFDNGAALDEEFHIYALEWGPEIISWLFDDQVYCTTEAKDWVAEDAEELPFDMPFQLEMRLTVDSARTKEGGHLTVPSALDPSSMPWRAEIDYVRVFYPEEEPDDDYEPLFPGEPLEDPDPPAEPMAVPYNNDAMGMPAPWLLPCRINAEAFDEGGQGIGFYDTEPGVNAGDSAIRPFSGVDIVSNVYEQDTYEWIVAEGPLVLMSSGEWLQYTVEVAEDTAFQAAVYFSTDEDQDDASVQFRLLADSNDCSATNDKVAMTGGQVLADLYTVPTGGPQIIWHTPPDINASPKLPVLTAGMHTIVFCTQNDINLSHLVFSIPGMVEAEVAAVPP